MKTSKNTHMFAYNIQNMAAKTNISQPLTIVKAEKKPANYIPWVEICGLGI